MPDASSSPRLRASARRLTEGAREAGRRFLTPSFLEEEIETAHRLGQLLAALMLVVFIPVTLDLIPLFQRILISLFLRNSTIGVRESAPFMITLVTLGMLVGAIWLWFQWVRSAGFGLLNYTQEAD